LVGLLAGATGLGYASWHAKQSLRGIIGLHFQELARHSADKVALMLAKEVQWVERLSVLPEVREAVQQGVRLKLDQPALQRWREDQAQYFRSLAIVDRAGNLVGGLTSKATRAHYPQQPWWPAVFEQGLPWAGDFQVDARGQGYWEVAVPIGTEEGPVLGALKVAIGTDALFGPVLRTRIGKTGHMMVLGSDGQTLVCPLMPPGLHHKTDAVVSGRDGPAGGPAEAVWREVRDDGHGGRDAIVGIAPVLLSAPIRQERIWYLLVRQDPAETYQPASALLWKLAGFWAGAIGLLVWLGTKLADLKKLEQAHQEITRSEEHYRTLWNHAVDAKFIVDGVGTVRDVNRRAEVKLGRRREELLGAQASDLFVEPDRARFRALFGQVLATGKEGTAGEMQVPTAHGAMLTADLAMLPIEQREGASPLLLQLSDVTERTQLARQLLRSERLASLSQFASMFAHDIRNPLAGIKKTLELLDHRGSPDGAGIDVDGPSRVRLFDDLHFTTDLLLGMINDMLDVYQESYSGLPLVCSVFSTRGLLEDVARLFKSEADSKGVTLRVEMPDEDLLVTGDRRRLQRVGINLVHNALKYAPAHSTVSLRAADSLSTAASIETGELATLLIQVEDEGPGVDPSELPHLFELFFRKKDGHDPRIGRGLGLHFCRLVTEAHGGRIWAENRPTGGARFSVALPVVAGDQTCRSRS
jgi:PAS domain S-box-containing protein